MSTCAQCLSGLANFEALSCSQDLCQNQSLDDFIRQNLTLRKRYINLLFISVEGRRPRKPANIDISELEPEK